MTADPRIILDAHQDIAWNALSNGREFTLSALQKRRAQVDSDIARTHGGATTGLPETLRGRVAVVFSTLFALPVAANVNAPSMYETPRQAYEQASAQLDYYHRLADENEHIALIRTGKDLAAVLDTWRDDVPFEQHKVGLVVLMEGADPIIEPRQFEEWYERGVRVVGPAWQATRYSAGTGAPGPLTALGRDLLQVMGSFNAILDLSHLAEEAYLEALDRYSGPLIASHSNPRRFRNTDRHLTDDMIRRLVERGGVIGTVIYNRFMWDDEPARKQDAPLSRVLDIIDHVCQVAGSAAHVGIGTDLDGGFGVERIPAEIDTTADLLTLDAALRARGFSDLDVAGILAGNFLRVLRSALPA